MEMTTKELLHQLIDQMDDTQAARALELLQQAQASPPSAHNKLPFIGMLKAGPDFAEQSEDMMRNALRQTP